MMEYAPIVLAVLFCSLWLRERYRRITLESGIHSLNRRITRDRICSACPAYRVENGTCAAAPSTNGPVPAHEVEQCPEGRWPLTQS